MRSDLALARKHAIVWFLRPADVKRTVGIVSVELITQHKPDLIKRTEKIDILISFLKDRTERMKDLRGRYDGSRVV
jgi:hypothetical protein